VLAGLLAGWLARLMLSYREVGVFVLASLVFVWQVGS